MGSAVSPDESLVLAASHGDIKLLVSSLDNGADPDATDRMGHSALHHAVKFLHVDIITELLRRGANPDIRSGNGRSPSMDVIMHGASEALPVLKLLVDAGASVNAHDNKKKTLLMHSVGYPGVVSYLLDKGADPHAASPGGTLLELALRYGYEKTVELLHDRGIQVNTIHRDGETSLIKASGCGRTELMSFLIGLGANPNEPGVDGMTPLMAAGISGNPAAIRLLIDSGADVHQSDHAGKNALIYAESEGMVINAAELRFIMGVMDKDSACRLINKAAMLDDHDMCGRLMDAGASCKPALKLKNVSDATKAFLRSYSSLKMMQADSLAVGADVQQKRSLHI